MSLLTEEKRKILIEECMNDCLDNMFGDGQEKNYVLDGFPHFKWLLNMTDDELLCEYGHYNSELRTSPELRAQAFRDELKEDEET